jgi:hypothetical protein
VRWTFCLVAFACAHGGEPHERPRTVAEAAPARPTASPPPDERACDELITHAVALGITESAARPGPRTTESDHEAVRRGLHDEFLAGCRQLTAAAYRCAMQAPTLAELAACQDSPSSSTSNSKVAPGGIAPPPAPRSP